MSETGLAFSPLLPWPAIAALAAAALALAGVMLARRATGAWWRILALSVLVLALVNPSVVREERKPLKDVAVVVVDESASQRIGARKDRTEAAVTRLRERLEGFADLELRVVRAGAPGEGGGPADGTRLFEALSRSLADVPRGRQAGAVMITDGQVHDAPAGESAEPPLDAPLHVLLTGRRGAGDRRLAVEHAPRYGIVGKTLEVTVRVEDHGAGGARLARMTLRRDAEQPRSMAVPVGEPHTVSVQVEHGGPNLFEIEVEAGPEELTLDNNRAVVVVNGVRDRLRVLLVSGEPHAGERVWRSLLKSDPAVALVHFTILRPPEKQDGTPVNELSLISFPIRELFEIRLGDFDLVIFDRYRRRGLLPRLYVGNLVRYVQKGGALLEAAGPNFATPLSLYRTPLGEILPAKPTGLIFERGYRPQVNDIGRRHPVTAELPGATGNGAEWGRWFRHVEVDTDGGQVLMHGVEGEPLLVLDRVGDGRVAQLLSDHIWLWARGFEGGGPQAELLRRLAHWLMKEPELEENDLRAEARGDRLSIVRRTLKPEDAPVTVTTPSGNEHEVTLEEKGHGRATAEITVAETGLYRITDGTRSTIAAVGALNPVEYADVRATAARLAPAVEATGGSVTWLGESGVPGVRRVRAGRDTHGEDRFGGGWIGLEANRDYVVTGVDDTTVLPAEAVLLLALGGLVLAWRREGR